MIKIKADSEEKGLKAQSNINRFVRAANILPSIYTLITIDKSPTGKTVESVSLAILRRERKDFAP